MTLLSTKVAVVTGAGRGLGAAYAKLLAREGAAVVLGEHGQVGRRLAAHVQPPGARRAVTGRAVFAVKLGAGFRSIRRPVHLAPRDEHRHGDQPKHWFHVASPVRPGSSAVPRHTRTPAEPFGPTLR